MIYRFRVILDNDTEDDVFRDLEIKETDTMEDLHNIITQSFGFDGTEVYRKCVVWEKIERPRVARRGRGTIKKYI